MNKKYEEILECLGDACSYCGEQMEDRDIIVPLPIRYGDCKVTKTINTKDNTIQRFSSSIMVTDIDHLKSNVPPGITISKQVSYICDPLYFHYECCEQFVKDNKQNGRYIHSMCLLMSMIDDIRELRDINFYISE